MQQTYMYKLLETCSSLLNDYELVKQNTHPGDPCLRYVTKKKRRIPSNSLEHLAAFESMPSHQNTSFAAIIWKLKLGFVPIPGWYTWGNKCCESS